MCHGENNFLPFNGVSLKSDQNCLNFIITSSAIWISDFNSFILLQGQLEQKMLYKLSNTRRCKVLERKRKIGPQDNNISFKVMINRTKKASPIHIQMDCWTCKLWQTHIYWFNDLQLKNKSSFDHPNYLRLWFVVLNME